jgi:hypothetical protein
MVATGEGLDQLGDLYNIARADNETDDQLRFRLDVHRRQNLAAFREQRERGTPVLPRMDATIQEHLEKGKKLSERLAMPHRDHSLVSKYGGRYVDSKKRLWPPPSRSKDDPDGQRLHCLICKTIVGQADPQGQLLIIDVHYAPCGLPCIASQTPQEGEVHPHDPKKCPRCRPQKCPLCLGKKSRETTDGRANGACPRCGGTGRVDGLEVWKAKQEATDDAP